MNRPLPERSTAEVDDTPAVVRENGERAHAIAEQLFRDFGPAIRIEVIGLDSPRGLWLGVRHRIGKGFAIVVDGRETVRGPTEYGPIKEAVKRALDRRTAR